MNERDYTYIFKKLLEITDDGFVIIDKDGKVAEINEQYCSFLKTSRSEAIGKDITEVIETTNLLNLLKSKESEEGMVIRIGEDTGFTEDALVIVNRSGVCDENGETVGALAQVKFRLQTMDSAQKLMKKYKELEYYKDEYLKNSGSYFDKALGDSEVFREVKKQGLKAARTSFPVLLTGGSFTGAKKGGKKGKIELADEGTLFLDEIGDMPLSMQAKLLRVLQEKEIEKIGGYKSIPVDIRIVAATRKNLEEMIENGQFREDLYYRLNVINIEMPPLRKRIGDIPVLARYFLNRLNNEYKTNIIMSKEVIDCFESYSWPGNIRELDNVIKSAYATCDSYKIRTVDLPSKIVASHKISDTASAAENKRLSVLMDEYEKNIIVEELRRNGWNCKNAAAELGIHKSLLYKKIAKYEIDLNKERYINKS